eukprot:9073133-Pyramimonas_sp.AAC.2
MGGPFSSDGAASPMDPRGDRHRRGRGGALRTRPEGGESLCCLVAEPGVKHGDHGIPKVFTLVADKL